MAWDCIYNSFGMSKNTACNRQYQSAPKTEKEFLFWLPIAFWVIIMAIDFQKMAIFFFLSIVTLWVSSHATQERVCIASNMPRNTAHKHQYQFSAEDQLWKTLQKSKKKKSEDRRKKLKKITFWGFGSKSGNSQKLFLGVVGGGNRCSKVTTNPIYAPKS